MKQTMEKFRLASLITIPFALCLYLLLSNSSPPPPAFFGPVPSAVAADRCSGRYVYVQSLPSNFNSDLVSACHNLSKWTDMCPFVANSGLGQPIHDSSSAVFGKTGWFSTNQFTLELIFHNRMKHYDCLASDSALASVVYVPYYAGLDVGRHLWGHDSSVRDSMAVELVRWVRSRPEWARMGGRDHFLVAGRISWDFRRLSEDGEWGNNFLFMPEAKNMSVLVIESSPWHMNDVGVPYPTYFHPSTKHEIVSWQQRMRRMKRPWLFSFAGAPRPNMTESIRGRLITQCRSSRRCKLLDCNLMMVSKCHSPQEVMKMFQRSVFCLQPQGDSYTRRSTFDAMLAGCIPVFFHPGSAYVQYTWHLPKNYTAYSAFIPEDAVRKGEVSIEKVLRRFRKREVRRMREEVVRLIPRLVYRDPRAKAEEMEGEKDAFDVAVEGVIERVEKMRREGVTSLGFQDEQNSWKYSLTGSGGEHKWDHFFFNDKS